MEAGSLPHRGSRDNVRLQGGTVYMTAPVTVPSKYDWVPMEEEPEMGPSRYGLGALVEGQVTGPGTHGWEQAVEAGKAKEPVSSPRYRV